MKVRTLSVFATRNFKDHHHSRKKRVFSYIPGKQLVIKHYPTSSITMLLNYFTIITTMLVFPIQLSETLNLCSIENPNSTVMSYYAKNFTVQNCGCEFCLKKCCKPGYSYKHGQCSFNSRTNFNVTFYKKSDTFVENVVDYKQFEVGLPDCSGVFQVKEFYIQQDFKVWIPKYNKYYGANHYCLDYNETSLIFLCFGNYGRTVRSITTAGWYSHTIN